MLCRKDVSSRANSTAKSSHPLHSAFCKKRILAIDSEHRYKEREHKKVQIVYGMMMMMHTLSGGLFNPETSSSARPSTHTSAIKKGGQLFYFAQSIGKRKARPPESSARVFLFCETDFDCSERDNADELTFSTFRRPRETVR